MNVTVLGAGNWGTTSALLLHKKGHALTLWEYYEERAEALRRDRENRQYLPGIPLPGDLRVTSDIHEALAGTNGVVFAVPSSVMRQTASMVGGTGSVGGDVLVASLSKGLEHSTLSTMSEVISAEVPDVPVVALSGPCIAGEVARELPTTIVAASGDIHAAEKAQHLFMTPRFRVYTSDDPLGVQLGGALKNIIAIAAGINDGLGFGTNAKSALVTRGIVEMSRLGIRMGAKPETFNGLSGIGDLITTCFSPHSRNRRMGEAIAAGRAVDDISREMVQVAEGVPTVKSVCESDVAREVDLPISTAVYNILYEQYPPMQVVSDLMLRERKAE